MQDRFITYINEEKKRGKTVLLSSHMFSEVDATCDRVSIIRSGSVVTTVSMDDVRHGGDKQYEITFASTESWDAFTGEADVEITGRDACGLRATVRTAGKSINALIRCLAKHEVESVSEIKMTLESYFLQFYKEEARND
jgi:ABC-2 type transport system ATP-binding protein